MPAKTYKERGEGLIVIAGEDYGMGSSRDWQPKAWPYSVSVAAVAKSFERIHRSNLIGMGVLPLQFPAGMDDQTLGLTGEETFFDNRAEQRAQPGQPVKMTHPQARERTSGGLVLRIDTAIEAIITENGGILKYVLRSILSEA